MISAVEAASFEKDRHRMDDTTCATRAFRTDGYWFLIETLPALEPAATGTTFVIVDRQLAPHTKKCLFREAVVTGLIALALMAIEC